MNKKIKKIEYPAICVIHTPSGPVNACEEHARQIEGLASCMGWYVNRTFLERPAECSNCVNENK
jgi:hypothetical protein